MRRYLKSEKGSMLAMATLFLIVFTLVGYGLMNLGTIDAIEVVKADRSIQTFWVAEAGLSRALNFLRMDFVNDPAAPSLADGDLNGLNCGPDINDFYTIPFSTNTVGNGTYVVEMKNVAGSDKEAWVRSTGTVGGTSRTIQVYLGVDNRNIWDNAIFAEDASDSGQNLINGNVTIAGSVHILGTNYGPNDIALDMSGGATIINNYEPADPVLLDIIPDCPQVDYNGETVDSLSAQVKVRRGQIWIDSASAGIGNPDVPGNQYKETVDAVYQNDGYYDPSGQHGAAEVFSDNGPYTPYDDASHRVAFPHLDDPYLGYASYYDFLLDNGLVITDADQLAQLANIDYTSNFDFSNAKGRIKAEDGHLTIDGIVYIGTGTENGGEGAHFKVTRRDTCDITYSGSAAILVTGDVMIDGDLLTVGTDSYPTNIIGIMTPNEILFGNSSQIDVVGVFYAEGKITAVKQTEVAGAWVSNCFDMGSNVPSIYQVKGILDHLPFGLIGSNSSWSVAPSSWEEI